MAEVLSGEQHPGIAGVRDWPNGGCVALQLVLLLDRAVIGGVLAVAIGSLVLVPVLPSLGHKSLKRRMPGCAVALESRVLVPLDRFRMIFAESSAAQQQTLYRLLCSLPRPRVAEE